MQHFFKRKSVSSIILLFFLSSQLFTFSAFNPKPAANAFLSPFSIVRNLFGPEVLKELKTIVRDIKEKDEKAFNALSNLIVVNGKQKVLDALSAEEREDLGHIVYLLSDAVVQKSQTLITKIRQAYNYGNDELLRSYLSYQSAEDQKRFLVSLLKIKFKKPTLKKVAPAVAETTLTGKINRKMEIQLTAMREKLIAKGENPIGVDAIIDEIRVRGAEVFTKIQAKIDSGEIKPSVHLKTSADDQKPVVELDRKAKVGVYALAGNPIHWPHIFAALNAMADKGLDKVVFVIAGEDPRKADDLLPIDKRHPMCQELLEMFGDLFDYSAIAVGTDFDGETNVFRMAELNPDVPADFYYIVGSDHMNEYLNVSTSKIDLLKIISDKQLQDLIKDGALTEDTKKDGNFVLQQYKEDSAMFAAFKKAGITDERAITKLTAAWYKTKDTIVKLKDKKKDGIYNFNSTIHDVHPLFKIRDAADEPKAVQLNVPIFHTNLEDNPLTSSTALRNAMIGKEGADSRALAYLPNNEYETIVKGGYYGTVVDNVNAKMDEQLKKMRARLIAKGEKAKEVDKIIDEIRVRGKEVLGKIKDKIAAKKINPNVKVRTSKDDDKELLKLDRKAKVGVYALAGNPIHWPHIFAALNAMADKELDKVVFVIAGEDPRKADDLLPVDKRHPMCQELLEIFGDLFDYSAIAVGTDFDGETNVFRMAELNQDMPADFYYIVGSDHMNEYLNVSMSDSNLLKIISDGQLKKLVENGSLIKDEKVLGNYVLKLFTQDSDMLAAFKDAGIKDAKAIEKLTAAWYKTKDTIVKLKDKKKDGIYNFNSTIHDVHPLFKIRDASDEPKAVQLNVPIFHTNLEDNPLTSSTALRNAMIGKEDADSRALAYLPNNEYETIVKGGYYGTVVDNVNAKMDEQLKKMRARLIAKGETTADVDAIINEITLRGKEVLTKIKDKIAKKEINPNVKIRTSKSDDKELLKLDRKAKVGVYALAGNPIHWPHIFAALNAMADKGLDKVVFVIAGEDPRKADDLLPIDKRHPMCQELLEMFGDLFDYSAIAVGTDFDGETNVFRMAELNKDMPADFYYIVGSDHMNEYLNVSMSDSNLLKIISDGQLKKLVENGSLIKDEKVLGNYVLKLFTQDSDMLAAFKDAGIKDAKAIEKLTAAWYKTKDTIVKLKDKKKDGIYNFNSTIHDVHPLFKIRDASDEPKAVQLNVPIFHTNLEDNPLTSSTALRNAMIGKEGADSKALAYLPNSEYETIVNGGYYGTVIDNSRENMDAELAAMRRELLSSGEKAEAVDAIIDEIQIRGKEVLDRIKDKIAKKEINPSVRVRTSADDDKELLKLDRKAKIGFYALAGNPIHWPHIFAALNAMADKGLDKVVFVIAGDDPRKTDSLAPSDIRHPMNQAVLKKFGDLFEYSSIAMGTDFDGETNVFRMAQLNQDMPADFYYIVGSDHMNEYLNVNMSENALQEDNILTKNQLDNLKKMGVLIEDKVKKGYVFLRLYENEEYLMLALNAAGVTDKAKIQVLQKQGYKTKAIISKNDILKTISGKQVEKLIEQGALIEGIDENKNTIYSLKAYIDDNALLSVFKKVGINNDEAIQKLTAAWYKTKDTIVKLRDKKKDGVYNFNSNIHNVLPLFKIRDASDEPKAKELNVPIFHTNLEDNPLTSSTALRNAFSGKATKTALAYLPYGEYKTIEENDLYHIDRLKLVTDILADVNKYKEMTGGIGRFTLAMLKGGKLGGMQPQAKDMILEQIGKYFNIVEGLQKEMKDTRMFVHWGQTGVMYRLKTTKNELPAEVYNALLAALNKDDVDGFRKILAGVDAKTVNVRALKDKVMEYLGGDTEYLLFELKVPIENFLLACVSMWLNEYVAVNNVPNGAVLVDTIMDSVKGQPLSQIQAIFSYTTVNGKSVTNIMKENYEIDIADFELQTLFKKFISRTDPLKAVKGSVRWYFGQMMLDKNSELRKAMDKSNIRPEDLAGLTMNDLAILFNGIHVPSGGSELNAEFEKAMDIDDMKTFSTVIKKSIKIATLKNYFAKHQNNVIAIDGTSGSGKGTAAKQLAQNLGFDYLDTGAILRVLTLVALKKNLDVNDEKALVREFTKLNIDFSYQNEEFKIFLDGKDVSAEIRQANIDANVFKVARHKGVLEAFIQLQRKVTEGKNVVVDGRNTGTEVFPNSFAKFYMNASLKTRAKRRYNDQKVIDPSVTLKQVAASLRERDNIDKNRVFAPLKKALDAKSISTTVLSAQGTVDQLIENVFETLTAVKTIGTLDGKSLVLYDSSQFVNEVDKLGSQEAKSKFKIAVAPNTTLVINATSDQVKIEDKIAVVDGIDALINLGQGAYLIIEKGTTIDRVLWQKILDDASYRRGETVKSVNVLKNEVLIINNNGVKYYPNEKQIVPFLNRVDNEKEKIKSLSLITMAA